MMRRALSILVLSVSASLALFPDSAQACAACYGQSDSPMAAGMNWGIVSLLVMIVLVLGGFAGFFVFVIRRAALSPAAKPGGELAQSWEASWPVAASPTHETIEEAAPRLGLQRESNLARQRKLCASSRGTSSTLAAPRSRS
jgi:hypothetical protein